MVCSVNSSERPSTTNRKPIGYMFAVSISTTGLDNCPSASVRIAATNNALNPISKPADNPERNNRSVEPWIAARPSRISWSRISAEAFLRIGFARRPCSRSEIGCHSCPLMTAQLVYEPPSGTIGRHRSQPQDRSVERQQESGRPGRTSEQTAFQPPWTLQQSVSNARARRRPADQLLPRRG